MTQLSYEQYQILDYLDTIAEHLAEMKISLRDYWESKDE